MSTRDVVLVALFAALMAALAVFPPLTIPALGVPITAQSLGPMLAGGILGARRGALSMLLLLVLVALGLPLLSGGRGGLAVFAGPTVGFLFGWVLGAFVTGWIAERSARSLNFVSAFLAAVTGGILVVYLVGVPAVALIADIPLWAAVTGSAVFIPGDLIKAGIAAAVIVALTRSYPMLPVRERSRRA